ncbi:MAG: hypothetical protein VYC39_05700 [Myxococcota bacterium]|nr:hypothetical protein [Myxococcota bacterium]
MMKQTVRTQSCTSLFLFLLAGLAACDGCSKQKAAEDSLDGGKADRYITFAAENTGLQLQLSEKWTPLLNPNMPESTIVDARYVVPLKGLPVRPRIIVSQFALGTEAENKLDELVDEAIDQLKGTLRRPNVKIKRVSTRSLTIDGRSAGGFDLKYAVTDPKSERESRIIQRTLLIVSQDSNQNRYKVEITATYVETDDTEVADEVESMFNSIKFNR